MGQFLPESQEVSRLEDHIGLFRRHRWRQLLKLTLSPPANAGTTPCIPSVPEGPFNRRWLEKTYARLCSELFGLETAKHGLEMYAPRAIRRARNKCSIHGRRRFGRRVPPDERVPSSRIESLMGRFWNGAVTVARLSVISSISLSRTGRVWGGITCRGSCSPPLIPHYISRRADVKIRNRIWHVVVWNQTLYLVQMVKLPHTIRCWCLDFL